MKVTKLFNKNIRFNNKIRFYFWTENDVDGFTLANLDEELKQKYFGTIKLDFLRKSLIADVVNDRINLSGSSSHISVEPQSPSLVVEERPKFPIPFLFPERRLKSDLREQLKTISFVAQEPQMKEIINAIFNEIRSLNM